MIPYRHISNVSDKILKSGNFPTREYSDDEKTKIMKVLSESEVFAYTTAAAYDYKTGDMIAENDNMSTDGVWCWDVETMHYFEKYNLALSEDFISGVVNGG